MAYQAPKISSTSPTTAATNSSLFNRPLSPTDMPDIVSSSHQDSTIAASSRISFDRRGSTITTTSAFSTARISLKSSASTFQTSVVDKKGNIEIVLDRPENSMLVLNLEQNKKSSLFKDLSFLAIQRNYPSPLCPLFFSNINIVKWPILSHLPANTANPTMPVDVSVIQQSGSNTLRPHRYDAGTDPDAWNLANLGQ